MAGGEAKEEEGGPSCGGAGEWPGYGESMGRVSELGVSWD